jgi:hypothetical protein
VQCVPEGLSAASGRAEELFDMNSIQYGSLGERLEDAGAKGSNIDDYQSKKPALNRFFDR